MGLDAWVHYIVTEPIERDAMASCEASPEYLHATLTFDTDKFRTGDDVGELVAHEMAHEITWGLWALAEKAANYAVRLSPKATRKAVWAGFEEDIRMAGELATTQVGRIVIRLLRRQWAAEEKLAAAELEIRALKKQLKSVTV